MNRVILTPAALPPSALAELKQWLGITTSHDDATLLALLATGTECCESFTGHMLLEAECEEVLAATARWQPLSTRPVQAIAAIEAIADDGARTLLPTDRYQIELDADGTGRVRMAMAGAEARLAVRFTSGLAADWDSLPGALRHGVMRLAAQQHRARDAEGSAPLPPPAVAALWRPWRRRRLT
jgi:uncharacterized phiE125 gp8 family phage protein